MTTNITLKNIPDDVYERLKWSAERHRRSINNEAIVCLASVLVPTRVSVAERIKRARVLRKAVSGCFEPETMDAFKRSGRA